MTTTTTTTTTMMFPLRLGIGWVERGLLTTMTTTLTIIDVKPTAQFGSKDEQETRVNARGKMGT
jgi:hypothetical protein